MPNLIKKYWTVSNIYDQANKSQYSYLSNKRVGFDKRVGWNLFLEKNKQACPFIREVRVVNLSGSRHQNNVEVIVSYHDHLIEIKSSQILSKNTNFNHFLRESWDPEKLTNKIQLPVTPRFRQYLFAILV